MLKAERRYKVFSQGIGLVLVVLLGGCARSVPLSGVNRVSPVYTFSERLDAALVERPYSRLQAGHLPSAPYLPDLDQETIDAREGKTCGWIRQKRFRAGFFLGEPKDREVVFEGFPSRRSSMDQKATVFINGRKAGVLSLGDEEVLKESRLSVPAEFFRPGGNNVELVFRYVRRSTKAAAAFHALTIADGDARLPASPEPVSADAFEQGLAVPANTRLMFNVLVPRGGRLELVSPEHTIYAGFRDGASMTFLGEASPGKPGSFSMESAACRQGVLCLENPGAADAKVSHAVIEGSVFPEDVRSVLLTIDTLRPDYMSLYGDPQDTTPFMKELGEEAVVFDEAFSVSYESTPSHASILLSRYPQSHGAIINGHHINKQQVNVSEYLQKEGYKTGGYVGWVLLEDKNITGKGFDRMRAIEGVPAEASISHKQDNVYFYGEYFFNLVTNRPFFLWVHSQYLHMGELPEAYRERFVRPEVKQRVLDAGQQYFPLLDRDGRYHFRLGFNTKELALSADEIEALRGYYRGALRFSDDLVGQFWGRIKQRGLDPYIFLAITSDHGVHLGEEHAVSHVGFPRATLYKVPLILRFPPSMGIEARRVPDLVETIDIVPTMLETMGIKIPRRMQGASLLALARQEGPREKPPYAFAMNRWVDGPFFVVQDLEWTYFAHLPDGRDGLYDYGRYHDDPQVSLHEKHPDVRKKYRSILLDWVAKTPSLVDDNVVLADEIKEMLQKSGYLEHVQ